MNGKKGGVLGGTAKGKGVNRWHLEPALSVGPPTVMHG
jgi:hypothetical protein